MPGETFLLPFRPGLDANAIPIVGARLEFYATQTSTPQAVFSDEALTVSLGPVVEANSAGVWPTIYLDKAKTYRVIMRSPDGGVLRETDPYVLGATDTLAPDVAANAALAARSAGEAEGFALLLALTSGGYVNRNDARPPVGTPEGDGYLFTLNRRFYLGFNEGGQAADVVEFVTAATLTSNLSEIVSVTSVPGEESRTLLNKLRDRLDLRDFDGLDLSGNNASTSAMQRAVNQAIAEGAALHIPAGKITLDSTISINNAISIIGQCAGTGKAMAGYAGLPVTAASQFHLAHDGKGFALDGQGVSFDWVLFRDIMTSRIQPTPVAGQAFTPGDQDYDFDVFNAAGLQLQNVCMLNPARGINLRGGGNIGRLWTDNLSGQPLRVGINVELSADVMRLHNTHFWPFWQDHVEVARWTLANTDHLHLKRCDTPLVSNYFSIGARSGLRIASNEFGGVTKLKMSNVDIDYGARNIWFDNTAVNCWAFLSNVTLQGAVPTNLANTPGVTVRENVRMEGAGNCLLFMNNIEASGASGPAFNLVSGNQRLETTGSFWLQEYGGADGNTDPGISVAVGSSYINSAELLNTAPGDGPLTGGGGRFDGIKQRYTPAVTSQEGSYGGVTAVCDFLRRTGGTSGSGVVTLDSIGGATGYLRLALPDAIIDTFVGSAMNISTGEPLMALGVAGNPGLLQIQRPGGGNPGAAGQSIGFSFSYNR